MVLKIDTPGHPRGYLFSFVDFGSVVHVVEE